MSTHHPRSVQAKHIFFACFGLLTLFVFYRNELPLMHADSPAWQHFAQVKWWLLPHALGGALALLLAPFQFSNRLRQRSLWLHRILGRLYVACVVAAAPVAVVIAVKQGPPTLVMAATLQAGGWMLTTAVALYCARAGNIPQHREWMIRSYPFAMVFVFTRALFAVPAIQQLGEVGIVSVVWSVIAVACFIPSFVINWRKLFPRRGDAVTKKHASLIKAERTAARPAQA
ncbi:MAG TPA: DUF2306 domain-containing protein [Pyrinomonadaceae bacterium]|jgi:uncharacterized membrane protein